MRTLYCLLFLSLSFCDVESAFAQTDINVDPLTGRGMVSIPLWKIGVGNISTSIAVNYNGGGIKVKDGGGNAGMGWNLSTGGQVSREVRGLPDDLKDTGNNRFGWFAATTNRSAITAFNPVGGCADSFDFNNNDTEPDIYYFSAAGISGKFVFDGANVIRIMPYQDLKIEVASSGTDYSFISFTITTNLGVKYIFSQAQSTVRKAVYAQGVSSAVPLSRDYDLYSKSTSFKNSWLLTSIVSPSGESIVFTYNAMNPLPADNVVKRVKSDLTSIENLYMIQDLTTPYRLTGIQGTSGAPTDYTATLTWDTNSGLISKVTINHPSATWPHEFGFNYDIVKNTTESDFGDGEFPSKSYLKSITESANCNPFPAYRFSYHHPELLPYRNGYPRDFFGYFNNEVVPWQDATPPAPGVVPTTPPGILTYPVLPATDATEGSFVIPSVYYNASASNGERYRIYPASGYSTLSSNTGRQVNPKTSYYGSLKRVTYPSGGFAEASYEPNEYFDDVTGTNQYGAGVRVKSVRLSDGDGDNSNDIVRNYQYKLSNGYSSGRWLYTPAFALNDGSGTFISPENLVNDETILYSRSTVLYPGNGKTVSEYNNPGHYPETTSGDWTATSTKYLTTTGTCSSGNLELGYYNFPFSPNPNFDFEQGLPSKISHYSESSRLTKETIFAYVRLATTAAPIKGIKFERTKAGSNNTFAYGLYTYRGNLGKVIQTQTETVYDQDTPAVGISTATNYVYNSTHQMLSEVNVTNSNGQVAKTQFSYAKDFGGGSTALSNLCNTITYNMHGSPVETVTYTNSVVTGASLNIYSVVGSSVLPTQQYSYSGTGSLTKASLVSGAFTYDNANYYLTRTIEGYNVAGMPIASVGVDKSASSALYGFDKSTVQAAINNARASEIVFSDFENSESYQVSTSNSTDAWTGKASYQFTGTITKSSIVKASALTYRFRVRAKSPAGGTFTIQPGGVTVSYPSGNVWTLIEAAVPISAASNPFTFSLNAPSTVIIDDLAFYPDNASVQSATYVPFAGKGSTTDNRGVTSFNEYDYLGRLQYVRDTDKNILVYNQNVYPAEPLPVPVAIFSASAPPSLGTSITFTSYGNCVSGLSYAWTVNGASVGTDSDTYSYSFPAYGTYEVGLTVSRQGESSSITSRYEIVPPLLSLNTSGSSADYDCSNYIRTFTINPTGNYDASTVTTQWFYKRPTDSDYVAIQSTPVAGFLNLVDFNPFGGSPPNAGDYIIYIKCEVKSSYGTYNGNTYATYSIHKPVLNCPQ